MPANRMQETRGLCFGQHSLPSNGGHATLSPHSLGMLVQFCAMRSTP